MSDRVDQGINAGITASQQIMLARARLTNGMHAVAALAGVDGVRAVFDAEMPLLIERFGETKGGGE